MLALARLNLPVQIGTSTLFKYLDEYTYRCVHADEVSSVISTVLEHNFVMNYIYAHRDIPIGKSGLRDILACVCGCIIVCKVATSFLLRQLDPLASHRLYISPWWR